MSVSESSGRFLRRYTELPYLIDYLQSKEIALLNPATWDDRNDSYYISRYAEANNLKSVYSLCLTEANETYHHWKVFSFGSGGVCIEFHKSLLLDHVSRVGGVRCEPVIYSTIDSLRKNKPRLNELPFLKRSAFGDELEFRLFMGTQRKGPAIQRLPIPLSCINRIVLSPWLPKNVSDQTKRLLKSVEGCSKLKIYRSTLVENENWKKLAMQSGDSGMGSD